MPLQGLNNREAIAYRRKHGVSYWLADPVSEAPGREETMSTEPFPPMSNALSRQVSALAKEYAEKHRVTYSRALHEVAAAYPELVERARAEVMGTRYESKTLDLPNKPIMTICLSAQISRMARERADAKGISFRQALSELGQESPELFRAARAQVLGEI
jgi:hypothetical protein